MSPNKVSNNEIFNEEIESFIEQISYRVIKYSDSVKSLGILPVNATKLSITDDEKWLRDQVAEIFINRTAVLINNFNKMNFVNSKNQFTPELIEYMCAKIAKTADMGPAGLYPSIVDLLNSILLGEKKDEK